MASPIAATDLIATAFRKLGVLADGETMPASLAAAGLQALNDVIETWSIETLSVIGTLPVAFNTVAGQATYTIGVGGNWNGQRPARIMSALHRPARHCRREGKLMRNESNRRFTDTVTVKCPTKLTDALDHAAQKQCTKPSDYIRRSLVNQLRADGYLAEAV